MLITIKESLLLCGNREKMLSKILKDNKRRRLKKACLENGDLDLLFSNEYNMSVKTVVKQYSKKKHKDVNECIAEFEKSKGRKNSPSFVTVWRVIKVIELPDVWLVLFERILK